MATRESATESSSVDAIQIMRGPVKVSCWLLLVLLAAVHSVSGFTPHPITTTSATVGSKHSFFQDDTFTNCQRQFATPTPARTSDRFVLHASRFRVRERIKRKFEKLTKEHRHNKNNGVSSTAAAEKEVVENISSYPQTTEGISSSTAAFYSPSDPATTSSSTTTNLAVEGENGTSAAGAQPQVAMASSIAVLEKPTPTFDSQQEGTTPTLADKVEDIPNTSESILTPDLPLPEVEQIQIRKLYTLPPVDRDLTRLETEFRNMLEFFSQFTEADLYTIGDARVRTIFEGVIASSKEPAVYRAFEVLFEDLVPLRIAGRMINSKLKQIMEDAQTRGQTEVDAIVETTGLPSDRVEVSRLAFLTLAVVTEHGHDDEAHLNIEQIVESGLAETAMQLLGYDDINDFIKNVDHNQDQKVTFSELMVGLQMMAEAACDIEKCDPAEVLQAVVNQVGPSLSNPNIQLDKKRKEYSDKFDEMVNAFQDWQDVIPTGEGRRLDVLRGCFVGAANQRVVEALRVVYLDYSALRVAGNTIFSLMAALVTQLRKRQQKQT